MRKPKRSGGFVLCLLLNILLNSEGLIPAVILLALHFALGWSWHWAALAAALWLAWIAVWTLFLSWASRCSGAPDEPKENKNPYSAGSGGRSYIKRGE